MYHDEPIQNKYYHAYKLLHFAELVNGLNIKSINTFVHPLELLSRVPGDPGGGAAFLVFDHLVARQGGRRSADLQTHV